MLLGLALLPVSIALDVAPIRAPWSEFSIERAGEEQLARGPELLAVGPDGRWVLFDPVDHEVVVVEHGLPALSFPVGQVSDLALVEDGSVLVLDGAGRQLVSWSVLGEELDTLTLPQIIPSSCTLAVEGRDISCVDVFGNLHRIARWSAAGFEVGSGPVFEQAIEPVQWDSERNVLSTGEWETSFPGALKVSGRRLGDWVVVDEVYADRPIRVRRHAWHLETGQTTTLPVEGRRYVPRGDLAVDTDGRLYVLSPLDAALEISRVSP